MFDLASRTGRNHGGRGTGWRLWGCLGAVLLVAASCTSEEPDLGNLETGMGSVGRWIVVLEDGAGVPDPATVASRHRLTPIHLYSHALSGFSAKLTRGQVAELRASPEVRFVEPDRELYLHAQVVPEGIRRIDSPLNVVSKIDGADERVAAGIAIIDTGIDVDHPELNVVGGVQYVGVAGRESFDPDDYDDKLGHGTHVAGIAAAIDNGDGVVGVAPGARLYAVAVFESTGSAYLSNVVRGVDWVRAHADTIDVANMSLGAPGFDDGNCGNDIGDSMHLAICNAVAAGVTFAVSAGNEASDTAGYVPGSYDEVITVSALADFDGLPGGLEILEEEDWYYFSNCTESVDDSFACFSNFGPDVDLIAPGVGILSTYTWKSGGHYVSGYGIGSGTSMSSPFVAGAAALYIAEQRSFGRSLLPAEVQADLEARGDGAPCAPDGPCVDDPDDEDQEPLVYTGVVDEPFEEYGVGLAPDELVLQRSGGAWANITGAGGFDDSQGLEVSVADDPDVPDYVLSQVCFNSTSADYMSASFSVQFSAFASWDAVGISAGGVWQYWWWIDGDGRVFEDEDVGLCSPAGSWHDITMTIDRDGGTADFVFDDVSSPAGLGIWPAADAPMDCLIVLAHGSDAEHAINLDNVLLRGRP